MIGEIATVSAKQTPASHGMYGSVLGFLRTQELGACLHGNAFGHPCFASSVRMMARRAVPRCLTKEAVRFPFESSYDKIFSSRWLNSSTVCFGTKDNKIVTWSHGTGAVAECTLPSAVARQADPAIPDAERRSAPSLMDCARPTGVHSIDINPAGSCLVATGSDEGDVTLLATDNMSPVAVLRGHNSCVFATRFISNTGLLSGGRDGLLLYWDLNKLPGGFDCFSPSSCAEATTPGGDFPVAGMAPEVVYQSTSRIRALEYDASTHTALALDGVNAVVAIDCSTMREQRSIERTPVEGLVALAYSADNHIVATGCMEGTLLYDLRTNRAHEVTRVGLPAGVRSLAFCGDVLAIGGGSGAVDFYDVRKLEHCCTEAYRCSESTCTPIMANGVVLGSGPQAVYTLQFDPEFQNKLFVGGGPLLCGSRGSYGSIWA